MAAVTHQSVPLKHPKLFLTPIVEMYRGLKWASEESGITRSSEMRSPKRVNNLHCLYRFAKVLSKVRERSFFSLNNSVYQYYRFRVTAPRCINQSQKPESQVLAAMPKATLKKTKEYAMTQNSCCGGVFLPSEIFAKSSNFQLLTLIFTGGAISFALARIRLLPDYTVSGDAGNHAKAQRCHVAKVLQGGELSEY